MVRERTASGRFLPEHRVFPTFSWSPAVTIGRPTLSDDPMVLANNAEKLMGALRSGLLTDEEAQTARTFLAQQEGVLAHTYGWLRVTR